MGEPLQPWQGEVWRRGARLGLVWLGLFTGVTIALYLLMGITGWSAVWRALCAMAFGPIIGIAVIAAWWMVRRPNLGMNADALHSAAPSGQESDPHGSMEQQ